MTANRRVLALAAALAMSAGCQETPVVDRSVPQLPSTLVHGESLIRRDLERRFEIAQDAARSAEVANEQVAQHFGDLAISLLGNGYFATAAETFSKAAKLDTSSFDHRYYLGHSLRRTGDMDGAAVAFASALGIEPRRLEARLWLAEVKLHREALDEAELHFSLAIEESKDCGQAWTGLGRIALSRGDNEEAIRLLTTALEFRPDSPPARYALALAYRRAGKAERARDNLALLEGENHSLTITCFEDPLMKEAWRRKIGTRGHEERAIKARDAGNPRAALVELRAAVRANPNRFPARYDIASILIRMNRQDEARVELEELLDQRPDYAAALSLLARLEASEGHWPRANDLFLQARRADPQSEQVLLDQADSLFAAGQTREAIRTYDDALEIEPSLERAAMNRSIGLVQLKRQTEALSYLEGWTALYPTRRAAGMLATHIALQFAQRDAASLEAKAEQLLKQRATVASAELYAAATAKLGEWKPAEFWQERALRALPLQAEWNTIRSESSRRLKMLRAGRVPAPLFDARLAQSLLQLDLLPVPEVEEAAVNSLHTGPSQP